MENTWRKQFRGETAATDPAGVMKKPVKQGMRVRERPSQRTRPVREVNGGGIGGASCKVPRDRNRWRDRSWRVHRRVAEKRVGWRKWLRERTPVQEGDVGGDNVDSVRPVETGNGSNCPIMLSVQGKTKIVLQSVSVR